MNNKNSISRRDILKHTGLATAAIVVAPMINRGRFRLFANSSTEYSRQAIDLYGYDAMPPELNKQLRAGYKGTYAFREKLDIEGLNHPKRMFDLTDGLIRRKYSDADIEGILGGNFERVLSQIWSV